MCDRAVTAGMPAYVEHGDVVHLGCHLGLMDAGAAVAKMLLARPEQPSCVACIAEALMLTVAEAEAGAVRLYGLSGFRTGFGSCASCRRRGRVVQALRGRRIDPGAARPRAAGGGQ